MLACNSCVESVDLVAGWWRIGVAGTELESRLLVNAAGLGAWDMARSIQPLDPAHIPPRHLAKGSYFGYSGKPPFTRLIYPLPVPGGLGTHLTLDMAGQARFGPDLQWVEEEDYEVDPARHGEFLTATRRIWPSIDPDRLAPAYAGIRPKIAGPSEPNADFVIQGEETHGLPGLVNLFGIESPGLTASLAVAEKVAAALKS
jgi:L-2-hydroxyglutarate oxidase LhgO